MLYLPSSSIISICTCPGARLTRGSDAVDTKLKLASKLSVGSRALSLMSERLKVYLVTEELNTKTCGEMC